MLKDIATLVQICFYIVGTTIAILTYRSAKRGLLNTVNTEYQKRVMDHLEKLSETLYAEVDYDSELYSIHISIFSKIRQSIFISYEEHLKENYPPGEFNGTFYRVPDNLMRIPKLIKEIKSDPFIPDDIAEYVIKYLSDRYTAMEEAIYEELKELETVLQNAKLTYEQYEKNEDSIILDLLKKYESSTVGMEARFESKGFGQLHVDNEVHKIRLIIKDYLKSFNPLP